VGRDLVEPGRKRRLAAEIDQAAVRPYKGILGNLFRVLGVAQKLVHHRKDAIPVTGDHLVKSSGVAALETVNKDTVEGNFLSFGRHAVFHALTCKFLDCSQSFTKEASE
jgi:hypothetical protein